MYVYFSGYPDPENFSWTEYLEATQTNAVPAKVFKMVRLCLNTLSTLNNAHVDFIGSFKLFGFFLFKVKCYSLTNLPCFHLKLQRR